MPKNILHHGRFIITARVEEENEVRVSLKTKGPGISPEAIPCGSTVFTGRTKRIHRMCMDTVCLYTARRFLEAMNWTHSG
jgi:hypothetical protein